MIKMYRKKVLQAMRPAVAGETVGNDDNPIIPTTGDMIAITGDDEWLVTKEYFEANYELAE